jgi:hypothetical protein
MNAGRFTLNFLGQKTKHEADIDYFKPYFLDYMPDNWIAEVNGGAFKFIDEDEFSYNCLIVHSQLYGICLMFDVWNKKFISGKSTVGDVTKMHETVDVGSDEIYPIGCFIPPNEAWVMVEQYLLNPKEYPRSAFLKDTNEIDWPEIF